MPRGWVWRGAGGWHTAPHAPPPSPTRAAAGPRARPPAHSTRGPPRRPLSPAPRPDPGSPAGHPLPGTASGSQAAVTCPPPRWSPGLRVLGHPRDQEPCLLPAYPPSSPLPPATHCSACLSVPFLSLCPLPVPTHSYLTPSCPPHPSPLPLSCPPTTAMSPTSVHPPIPMLSPWLFLPPCPQPLSGPPPGQMSPGAPPCPGHHARASLSLVPPQCPPNGLSPTPWPVHRDPGTVPSVSPSQACHPTHRRGGG